MSSGGRAPWWYSGEDDQPGPEPESPPELAPEDVPEGDDAESDGTSSAMDWMSLVAGAVKMVDWATERVMAPHAEHTDPAEHPECMVCRTVTLIGDPVGLMGGGQHSVDEPDAPPPDLDEDEANSRAALVTQPSAAPVPAAGAQPIRWIPIDESGN